MKGVWAPKKRRRMGAGQQSPDMQDYNQGRTPYADQAWVDQFPPDPFHGGARKPMPIPNAPLPKRGVDELHQPPGTIGGQPRNPNNPPGQIYPNSGWDRPSHIFGPNMGGGQDQDMGGTPSPQWDTNPRSQPPPAPYSAPLGINVSDIPGQNAGGRGNFAQPIQPSGVGIRSVDNRPPATWMGGIMGTGQDQNSPDYQAGYQAGLQQSQAPGTPPLFIPAMQQPVQAGFAGQGDQGQQQPQAQGMGGGQDTPDTLWDKYQSREVVGAMGAGAANDNLTNANSTYDQRQAYRDANVPPSQQANWNAAVAGGASFGQAASGTSGGSPSSGGGPANSAGTTVVNPADAAQLANDRAQIAVSQQTENDRHQEAEQNIALATQTEQDQNKIAQMQTAETNRHNKATEDLTRQQQQLDLQMKQMDEAQQTQIEQMTEANAVKLAQMSEGNQIYMQQGQQAFTDWQTRQTDYMNILNSALSNPWIQQLTGMAPPGQEAAVMGGGNIPALIAKILQPYDVSQFGAQNAPAAAGLNVAPVGALTPGQGTLLQPTTGLTWNDLSDLMQKASGGNYNDSAAKSLWQDMANKAGLDSGSGAVPMDITGSNLDAIITAGTGGKVTSWGQLTNSGPDANPIQQSKLTPTGTAGTAGGQQTPANQMQMDQMPTSGQGTGDTTQTTQQVGLPSWTDWQSWSPWQKAAYRTNVEAEGPGAWNTQQQSIQGSFTQQGGTPDITQLASAAANPAEAVGQQMTAEAFGQTPQQWQTQQSRQWSQAQAPQVKQNIAGGGPGAATPESQYGL